MSRRGAGRGKGAALSRPTSRAHASSPRAPLALPPSHLRRDYFMGAWVLPARVANRARAPLTLSPYNTARLALQVS